MRVLTVFSLSFAFAAGLWQLPANTRWVFVLIAALIGLAAVLLRGGKRPAALVAGLGFLAGGGWCLCFDLVTLSPAAGLDGEIAQITVRLTDFPETGEYYTQVRGRLVRDGRDIPILLRLEEGDEALSPGDRISVEATLYRADISYGEQTWGDVSNGIFLRGYARGEARRVDTGSPLRYAHLYLARAVGDKIAEIFPRDAAGFATAIVTGDRGAMDSGVYGALVDSGIAHLVAVSGMHVAFLVGLLVSLMGPGRRTSLIAIPVILVFVAMTGARPSAVRAGIMQILLLLAPLFGRESDGPTSLGTALLLILLINPYAIAGIGLQLSFLSVVGLLTVAPRVRAYLTARITAENRFIRGALHFAAASLAVSLGAIVFTTPVSAFHFDTVSLYAPLTNLLTVWAAALIFAGVLAAVILGALFTPLGRGAAHLVALPIRYVQWVAAGIARFPLAVLYTYSGYIRIWLAGVYATVALYLSVPGEKPRPSLPVGLGAGLLLYCLFLGGLETSTGELTVTALDVGQGQSILLSSPNVHVLVDCGGERSGQAGSIAAEHLYARSIYRLDMLVITHFDADHVNGVLRLMGQMPVDLLAVPDAADGERQYREQILALAESLEIPVHTVKNDTVYRYGTERLTIFAPLGSAGDNERGLSVLMTSGEFDALVTGDMSQAIERRLVQLADLPDIEVLVVGHHGSKYSTSPELLETVLAEVAIISVGEGNPYGHPSPEVIARLDGYGAAIYRTDRSGHITVRAGR